MGELIALRKVAEKVEELFPPVELGKPRPAVEVLGVWEAHAEIERLKAELADANERLSEACRAASQQKRKAEARQAEVMTYRRAIRDLAIHNCNVRKHNGEMALTMVKLRRKNTELMERNARLRTEHGEFKVPVVSLAHSGLGTL